MESIECSICCEEVPLNCFIQGNRPDVFITSCGHHFHKNCISRWCLTNNSCPICRKQNIYTFQKSTQNGFQVIFNMINNNNLNNTYINNTYINNTYNNNLNNLNNLNNTYDNR